MANIPVAPPIAPPVAPPIAPPIAPPLALTQGVQEVMYDLAQWAAWQHFGTGVSVKRAHKKLAALRAAMAPGTTVTEQIRDLGRDQEILDYVSCRDDAQEIIGSGITKLETRGQLAVASSFSNIHQQDHISARQARAWLQWIMGLWYDLPHPRPRFYKVNPPFTGAQKNEKFIH